MNKFSRFELYRYDVLNVIKSLEDNSVDLIFTELSQLKDIRVVREYDRVLKNVACIVSLKVIGSEREIVKVEVVVYGNRAIIHKHSNDIKQIIDDYTNESDVILDTNMLTGEIGMICRDKNRGYIGIEEDFNLFEIASYNYERKLL